MDPLFAIEFVTWITTRRQQIVDLHVPTRGLQLTNGITPISDDCWAGNSAVDGQYNSLNTIWSSSGVCDFPPILASHTGIWCFIVVVGADIVIYNGSVIDHPEEWSLLTSPT